MSVSLAALLATAQAPATLATQCAGRDGWNDPAPPARIHGDTYYVGTCGIAAILIAGRDGHVLIDGATERAAPLIAANVARLGFRMRDVRLILNSHEHHDHAGGIAALQRLSGATVAALPPAVPVLTSGRPDPEDPQAASLAPMPPVPVARTLRDGETVRLGATRLTVHATPGHSPGGTSWSWRSCARRACVTIVYADSLTAVSADGYRFSDHPAYVARLRRSIARVGTLRCGLLVTPHPGASSLFERMSAGRLVDPTGCRDYAARSLARLDARLAEERTR